MKLPVYSGDVTVNPRKLFLFSHTKVGKTTLASALPNSLLIDTEDGSEYVKGVKFNVLKYAREHNILPTKALSELAKLITDENKTKGDYVYDYGIIDTATGLELFAKSLAVFLYKKTNQGKTFVGDDVTTDLPNGGGYDWLRKAFELLFKKYEGLFRYGLIILGHVKNSSINKEGKDLNAKDIFLTGKLKQIMTAQCDAIGYLYRNKENPNQVIVSFKTHELDLATGSRSEHLRNQEFVLSELTDGGFKFNWDKIYLPNKQKGTE